MWRTRRFIYKSCRGGAPVPARNVTDCTHKKHRNKFAAVFLFFICEKRSNYSRFFLRHLRKTLKLFAFFSADYCAFHFSRSLRGIERASRSILPGLNPTLRRAGT